MGFKSLGQRFSHWEWEKIVKNGNAMITLEPRPVGFDHWEEGFGKINWAGKWAWYPPFWTLITA